MTALSWLLILAGACVPARAEVKEFSNWPPGTSPLEIGKRVAERFAASGHLRQNTIIYPEVCAWYGALTFAQLSGDKDLTARLIARFDPLLTPAEATLIPAERHVDFSVFGAVPFEIFLQSQQSKYLDLGKSFADRQWLEPDATGLTGESRFWIDDMFMITAVQVQAWRATRDRKYLDRAALEMSVYLDRLQQANGLFYHAPDVPFFWGRGNGWAAAGMTELLRSLPKDHPQHGRILEAYRKMIASLLKFQSPDGMWRQLIDHPEAWPETSSTGMFTFAMVTGVKQGWLDAKTYAPAARKAWLGLTGYIDKSGDIGNVCEGTNKLNDLQYYLNRARKRGDLHGQAPILWTVSALLRPDASLPTLFIAGDSTANNVDHRGWGDPIADYLDPSKISVQNRARAGRSARTFFTEGLWDGIMADIKPGDFVLIQFGHNDGSAPDRDRARGDLPGIGDEARMFTMPDGRTELVHTFGWYLRRFVADAKTKGARPIVLSLTVRNIWEGDKVERGSASRQFGEWSKQVADAEKVPFLDATDIIADAYEKMGRDRVKAFFPEDHTHPSPPGADLTASLIAEGLQSIRSPLAKYIRAPEKRSAK